MSVLLAHKNSVAVKVGGGKSEEKSAPVLSAGYQSLTPDTFTSTAKVGKCPKRGVSLGYQARTKCATNDHQQSNN
jgi:hypothetical protein